ncbi:hypothetical protein HN747_03475 [archaeon]|jgi:hypothetical protein|nr:hypothetical protein [archaeon]
MEKRFTNTVKKIAPYVVAAGIALSSAGCGTTRNYNHLAIAPGNVQYSGMNNGQRFRFNLDERRGNRIFFGNRHNSVSVRTRGSRSRGRSGSGYSSAHNPSNY